MATVGTWFPHDQIIDLSCIIFIFYFFRLTLFGGIQVANRRNLSTKQKQQHTMEMDENKFVVIF